MQIATRHLFDLRLTVPEIVDVGDTPAGRRRVATVTGGEFEGERLKGKARSSAGGDWLLLRSDGVLTLDVRLQLETDQGELVYMSYRGLRHGPAEIMAKLAAGESVDPSLYYFRIVPVFETGAPRLQWLHRIIAVGTGRREAAGPVYSIHEVL